ncbi:MAG: histidinol dehydrogenase [Chloroflexi bacterium]|nr:histidinol dehydrogenase [Chloroflexota bacterium]
MAVLRRYTPEEARATLLRRVPIDEREVPRALLESLAQTFGEPVTPDQAVARILADVRRRGDAALHDWTERLDHVRLPMFRVPDAQVQAALEALPADLRASLTLAAERIRAFHAREPVTSWLTQDLGGTLGMLIRPLERVGIYIPGGRAPLPSTVLMTAIPARVAGVDRVIMVTPPRPETRYGDTWPAHPAILAAAALARVDEVYLVGGAQAIAALAYGTESIPQVDKIVGPGNLFVTLAKKQVFGRVGIDGLAGPTETLILADETANPAWVAADLLAQAEHDPLAAAILLTPSESLLDAVDAALAAQIPQRARRAIIEAALAGRSGAVLTRDLDEALALANAYAAEHVALAVADPWSLVPRLRHAGCVFVGEHSYEVLGDYLAGPNHVLPTDGTARFASALSVWDFVKRMGLVALDPATARELGPHAARLADTEALDAHAAAARIREAGAVQQRA